MADLLDDLRPSVKYRTPAEVRAIPNQQWERWVLGYESFPFTEFSAEAKCQETVTTIIDATCRRLGLKLPRGRKRRS